jgi:hypothetical protein
MEMVINRSDEQIVSKANCTPARLKLMIKALSIGPWNNTAEENLRLAAAKRLLAKMGTK